MVGWCISFVATVVVSIVVAAVYIGYDTGTGDPVDSLEDLSIGALTLLQLPLWLGLFGTPLLARTRGLDWRRHVGFVMRLRDIPLGLGIGIVGQVVLVPLLYWPILRLVDLDVEREARELVEMAISNLDHVLLVVMTVVIAPIVEETFFRGLLQGALKERFGTITAVAVSSVAFAATHFQPVQFPALVLIGLVFALLTHFSGRLGPAIWAHVGFNSVTVALLIFWA